MGLDISHDAFSGGYLSFHRLRTHLCVDVLGGTWDDSSPPYVEWEFPDGMDRGTNPGLFEFLCHSDCNGEIDPELAGCLADELEALLPRIGDGGAGHIERDGGYRKVVERLIAGCRRAAEANEPLEFH